MASDSTLSPESKASFNRLIVVVKLLTDRVSLNSRNSSKPPASDPNRPKKSRAKSKRPAGGQNGHVGTTLRKVDNPDQIKSIKIDKRTLPKGDYTDAGVESRQLFELRITRHVTEFQAQVLENAQGRRFVAPFPEGVTRPAQYGRSVKSHAVYLSVFQWVPYERIQAQFAELYQLPLSAGSLFNFNRDAFERLPLFLALAKQQLSHHEAVLNVDETSVNVGGKRVWLHNASNEQWTLIEPHARRGKEAMDAMGVLPEFNGYLVHDHWKPYYQYNACTHALCNAHHKRELTYAREQDGQRWAQQMERLLDDLNCAVKEAGGCLPEAQGKKWRAKYRRLLNTADKECPPPAPETNKKTKGRQARSKSRNLLERLGDYEADVLRFMDHQDVPFTNNQGERDIRMSKVQQKISGCFRSMQGAEIFCALRSYLSTCQKHQVDAGKALEHLFAGTWPEFIQKRMDDLGICAE